VRLGIQVAALPSKAVLIFDGECNFCRLWVNRWRISTSDQVDYIPFQDPQVAQRFPELPRQGFETAVHLIEIDGSVYSGAEAAFRALAHSPHDPLLLEWYLRWPSFRRFTETSYRFIARHRGLFSAITRLAWGRTVEPSSYVLVRWAFLKGLGVIYLVAFLSLWVQIMGLIGSNGILPASLTMFGFRQEASLSRLGVQRYDLLPTFCWFSASDGFLKVQCAAGTFAAVLLIGGIAPAPCLFLLWLIYLSLAAVSREFFGFQWDYLLLETGFLAIFFAPLELLPRGGRSTVPSCLLVWLLRWLLFRLMFGSGLVKLLSGDPTWRHFTALKFHYETQPLPTWIGWYAHQLPGWLQQICAFLLLAVELGLPLLIFAPRRLRHIPFAGFVLLQVLILLTGNYCFFNWLTILLCLVLLDDAALEKYFPNRWRSVLLKLAQAATPPTAVGNRVEASAIPTVSRRKWRLTKWPIQMTFPLTFLALFMPMWESTTQFQTRASLSHSFWPQPLRTLFTWVAPLRSFNTYGLFRDMTTNRLEIVIQGSNDGINWLDYEFKDKPGDVNRRPAFVAPHQPRLDWQMWFAALGDFRQNPWFVEFCFRVMSGSPQVLALLQRNPFPQAPPRYMRALLYQYHFTDLATHRRTGAWWRRELKGQYLPTITMSPRQNRQIPPLEKRSG
jgi:predicted DCC family thiol-disulfide oxidoreductase YuxK